MKKEREIPNSQSKLLSKAVIGGAGLSIPPDLQVPEGMAMVLLLVPIAEMVGKSMPELQADMGLPWHLEDGDGVWFDELE